MNARWIAFAALGGILLLTAALLFAGGGDDAASAGPAGASASGGAPGAPPPAAGDSLAGRVGELADGTDGAADGTDGSVAATAGTGSAAGAAGRTDGTAATGATADRSGASSSARPAAERPGTPVDAAGTGGSASDGAAPAAAPAQEGVEEILRATARRYEGVRSIQADFQQQLTNALLGRTTRSAGTLYQRQPDRFLMRFSQPAGDIIVSDGEYFWVYYPSSDPKQVIRSSRGAGGLDLRSQFVGDPVRRFAATSEGAETVRGRATHVLTLTPRERTGYRRLKVWIDAEDHLVRRFELTEDNGNVRRFELTNLRVNPTLPDDLFTFEPPAGAVVVSQ